MRAQWSVLYKTERGFYAVWSSDLKSQKEAEENIADAPNWGGGDKEFIIMMAEPWEYK